MKSNPLPLPDQRAVLTFGTQFRCASGLGGMVLFYLLGHRLPFPYPNLVVISAVLFVSALLLHVLVIRGVFEYAPLREGVYLDVALFPFILYATGGFLSPFLLTQFMTAMGSIMVYERRTGVRILVAIVAVYVGISLAQKFGVLANPVGYSRALMQNGAFFYAVLGTCTSIFLAAYSLTANAHLNMTSQMQRMLDAYERTASALGARTGAEAAQALVECMPAALEAAYVAVCILEPTGASATCYGSDRGAAPLEPTVLASSWAGFAEITRQGRMALSRAELDRIEPALLLGSRRPKVLHGLALRSSGGDVLGFALAGWQNTEQPGALCTALLDVFAARLGTELERARLFADERQWTERRFQASKLESLGQLAGGVAHDFNNQLTGIIGLAELARTTVPKESEAWALETQILDLAWKSAGLARRLLTFARLRPKQTSRAVDASQVLGELCTILPRTLGSHIEVRADLPAEALTTHGDPAELYNTLLNLCLNARDAMPDGGTLGIVLDRVDLDGTWAPRVGPPRQVAKGAYARFVVSDTGTGIPEAIQERIFEPFFTTKERGKGTGLGLASAYGYVQSQEGLIDFASTPGKGSSFSVFLPLVSDRARPSVAPPSSGAPRSGRRVLLADDEPMILKVMGRGLKAAGHSVITCADGEAALAHVRSHPAELDVVVLDMTMPKMGGRQVLAQLREHAPSLPVILMTGFTDDGDRQSLTADGATEVLYKPFSVPTLLEAVDRVVG